MLVMPQPNFLKVAVLNDDPPSKPRSRGVIPVPIKWRFSIRYTRLPEDPRMDPKIRHVPNTRKMPLAACLSVVLKLEN